MLQCCQKEQDLHFVCAPVRLCVCAMPEKSGNYRGIETKLRTATFVRNSFLLCNVVTSREYPCVSLCHAMGVSWFYQLKQNDIRQCGE